MNKQSESQGMRDTAVPGPTAPGSWDPYDVWLNRVKKPREVQAVRTQTIAVEVAAQASVKATPVDLSETARMRALTLPAG